MSTRSEDLRLRCFFLAAIHQKMEMLATKRAISANAMSCLMLLSQLFRRLLG